MVNARGLAIVTNATPVNLVRVTCLSTGTSTLSLGPAVAAFRDSSALIDGGEYSYSIQQGSNYEFGRGIYDASGPSLTRGVIGSSNGNAPLNLSANAVIVFPALAEDLQVPGPQGPQGIAGPAGTTGAMGANGAGINMPVVGRAGAYTLALVDRNTFIIWSDADDVVVTIPASADVVFLTGDVIAIEQGGEGTVTIAAAEGVTMNCRGEATGTAGQFAVCQLKYVGGDVWTLLGDVA